MNRLSYLPTRNVRGVRTTPAVADDQRLGQRVPYVHDVKVIYHGAALEATCTRDVSLKGMRVATKCFPISLDAIVHVELKLMRNDGDYLVRLPARVTQSSGLTLGLRLLGFDKQLFQWMRKIIEAHTALPESRFAGHIAANAVNRGRMIQPSRTALAS